MKLLVVGGSSSVARALVAHLGKSVEIVTAGRSGCDVHFDITTSEDISPLVGVDAVVNTAGAFSSVWDDSAVNAMQVNVVGAIRLARLCHRAGVNQLINISSIYATLSAASPFFGPYALTKRHADEALEHYAASAGLSVCILRPSRLYGVGFDSRKHQPFLSLIIEKAFQNEEVVFFGNHDARRNFLHLNDLAAIIEAILIRRLSGVYACSHPQYVKCSDIAEAAALAFGKQSRVRFDTQKPDIPDDVFETSVPLFEAIGFSPAVSIAEGMMLEAANRRST